MRNTSAFIIPALAIIFLISSCSKEMNNSRNTSASQTTPSTTETINASVTSGQTYSLSFDQSANVSIYKQAAHFSQSNAQLNNETGKVTYTYVPAVGFSGDDEVTLSKIISSEPHSGCHNGSVSSASATSYVNVKIKVTQ